MVKAETSNQATQIIIEVQPGDDLHPLKNRAAILFQSQRTRYKSHE